MGGTWRYELNRLDEIKEKAQRLDDHLQAIVDGLSGNEAYYRGIKRAKYNTGEIGRSCARAIMAIEEIGEGSN